MCQANLKQSDQSAYTAGVTLSQRSFPCNSPVVYPMQIKTCFHRVGYAVALLLCSNLAQARVSESAASLLKLTGEHLVRVKEALAQPATGKALADAAIKAEAKGFADRAGQARQKGATETLARAYFNGLLDAASALRLETKNAGSELPALPEQLADALAAASKTAPELSIEEIRAAKPSVIDALTWKIATHGLASQTQAVAGLSRLDGVQRTGLLRVCMTGDYKPFTIRTDVATPFSGVDVEMARLLAASLKADLSLVPTTWGGLMNDFLADRCDIANGGVSITMDRARQASFSVPLLVDGKTPIVRCEDKDKYQTLEQIDRPGVRVIVNPGGTNERFAKANIKQATLTVYPDNVTVFEQIANNKADLMMTDAIETLLQQKQRPALCAVHPDKPFTVSEKAYMLPRGDVAFKEYVDQFLHLSLIDGTYRKFLDSWVK